LTRIKNQILNHIHKQFSNTYELQREYRSHPGYSKLEIKNFLPINVVHQMAEELEKLPLEQGKKFTRKGSCMYEYNDLDVTPTRRSSTHITQFYFFKMVTSSNRYC